MDNIYYVCPECGYEKCNEQTVEVDGEINCDGCWCPKCDNWF